MILRLLSNATVMFAAIFLIGCPDDENNSNAEDASDENSEPLIVVGSSSAGDEPIAEEEQSDEEFVAEDELGEGDDVAGDSEEEPPPCFNDELIVNGGFEDDVLNSGWTYSSEITGWNIRDGENAEWQRTSVASWGQSYEGDQWMELDAHGNSPGSTAVDQQFNLEDGTYKLRYAYAPRPGRNAADNTLLVEVMNTDSEETIHSEQQEASGVGHAKVTWTEHELTFEAKGNTMVRFSDIGTNNSLGTFIDGVSLQRVCPE